MVLQNNRVYVLCMSGDLVYVVQVVHGAVKTVAMNNRSVLPENARKEIFLNIGEIYTLHFDLLQELEMQLEQWCAYMTACLHPAIIFIYADVHVSIS